MNPTLKDKIIYASKEEREALEELLLKMAGHVSEFSSVAHSTERIRFTEFSMLYLDLHHFLDKDVKTTGNVSLKDLKSFANSFYFLYSKTSSLFGTNNTQLNLFLYFGYSYFDRWFSRGCSFHKLTPD